MAQRYVEKIDEAYRICGSRISLDSVIHSYWNGQTAESITQSFPGLTLEQVYGALAFYLSHQTEIDAYLQQGESDFEAQREAARRQDPMFYQKLTQARRMEPPVRP